MFKGLTDGIPFFKYKDNVFISNFVPLLIPLKVHKGEFIYKKGEHPILSKNCLFIKNLFFNFFFLKYILSCLEE